MENERPKIQTVLNAASGKSWGARPPVIARTHSGDGLNVGHTWPRPMQQPPGTLPRTRLWRHAALFFVNKLFGLFREGPVKKSHVFLRKILLPYAYFPSSD